jgi:tetratricopeptide (TPR) repeat protein
VLFAGALFSKTVTASLPVAILLVWWWKGRKIVGRDLLLLAPFFLLGIVLGAFTAVLERSHVGAVGKEFDFSFFERVQLAGSALWFYAWKLVWPANLTFVYPKQNWHIGAGDALGYLFPIAAVGVVVGLWALRRRIGRGPLAAVLFFIISLFPALGFFNIYPMRYAFAADHYQYLACIGLIALAVGILAHLMPKLADNAFPLRLGAGHAVMGALLVVLIYLSAHHAGAFESSEALWRDTLTKNTTSWMVPTNLAHTYFIDGRAYEEAGRGDVANQYYEQAMLNYQRALQLAPGLPETHFNLGELLAQRGQPDAALQEFRAAVEKNSKFPLAYESMGLTFMRRQEWDRAIENFGRALEFNPALWKSRMNLGVALIRTGKLHEAAEQFQMVTTQVPDLVDAHYRLGDCLAQLGDLAGAIGEYRTVVDLKPDYAEAYLALAKVLYASGNEAEALRSLAEVNRLKPELTRRAEKILATQPATSAPAATTAPAGSTPAVSTPAGSTPAATRP